MINLYNYHEKEIDSQSLLNLHFCYLPVVQAPGGSKCVKWDSWENFMDGNNNNFKGVYKPKASTHSDGIEYRDLFVSMGTNTL